MEDGNGQTPAPKISGLSTPVGSSTARKQESPEQRSNNINSKNAQEAKAPIQAKQRQQKPVTQQEVDNFRKHRSRKRLITTIIAIFVILAAAAIVYYLHNKYKKVSYNDNATIYNDSYPIVVKDKDSQFLISQNGKKISDNYDAIEEFTSESSLAISFGETPKYYILGTNGEVLFESDNLINKTNDTDNYIVYEESGAYILKPNGQKLSELKLTAGQQFENKYSLVQNDNKMAIIDENGNEKMSRILDKIEPIGFSFAYNQYEDKYYCAVSTKENNSTMVNVYNCETAKIAKTFENNGYYADFYDSKTPLLTAGDHYYYFYADDVLYESEQPSTEVFAGIIETSNEDGTILYFDPKEKSLLEQYPSHSLIAQKKLSTTTEITKDCTRYAKSAPQKLTKICNNIYQENNLLELDYANYSYDFFPEKLAKYLSYLNKNYVIRSSISGGSYSVFDLGKKTTVEGLGSVQSIDPESESSFVYTGAENDMATYYNIITDKTVAASVNNRAELGINYLAIDDGNEITYYNKEAKEIYKVTRGN